MALTNAALGLAFTHEIQQTRTFLQPPSHVRRTRTHLSSPRTHSALPRCAALPGSDQGQQWTQADRPIGTFAAGVEAGLAAFGRAAAAAAICGVLTLAPVGPASARLEGVNKPELLPTDFTRVIDTGGFLSTGQIRRLSEDLQRLEEDTGFKVRVLAQSYPNTPGLAIRDYWGVDDDTIVFVADPTFKNILNFNVGSTVDLRVPRSFWSRLAGKYGNIFFWRDNGEDAAIEAAVVAIDACLREEPGPRQCADIK